MLNRRIAAIAFFLIAPLILTAKRVIDVSEYMMSDVHDCTPVVASILKDHPKGNIRIVFPRGVYHFYPEYASGKYHEVTNHDNGYKRFVFLLESMKNVEIDGQGSEFIFHGTLTPFLIDGSSDVLLRGFSVDWAEPFNAQAVVLASDLAAKTVDLKFRNPENIKYEAGRINILNNGNEMFFLGEMMVFDPKTKAVAYDASKFTTGGAPSRLITAEKLSEDTYRIHMPSMRKRVPEGMVYVFKGPNGFNRLSPAVHVINSKDVSIEYIDIHHAGGMGIIGEKSENVYLRHVNVCLKDGTDRMITTTADATHFCNCRGELLIEDCLFENMLDDATNVHGTYMIVDTVLNEKTLIARLNHFQQSGYDFAQKNDVIQFVRKGVLTNEGQSELKACEKLNDEYYRFVFKNEIPASVGKGDALENITWYPDLIMRNNVIRNNRARSILLSLPGNTLIEGNTFSSMMTSVLITSGLDKWAESGATKNIIIRNNRFEDSCYGGKNASLIWVNPLLDETPENVYFNKNIIIEGNTFNSFDRSVLNAKSVENLVFRNNELKSSGSYPMLFPNLPEINVDHCLNLEVSGNRFDRDNVTEIVTRGVANCEIKENVGDASHNGLVMKGVKDSLIGKKRIFDKVYPSYASFRGEFSKEETSGYASWVNKMGDADVIIKKFIQEEIDIDIESQKWASKFAKDNPEVLILLHLNGEARQITEHEDVLDKYYPGHWVYQEGSLLESDATPQETVFKVSDVKPFMSKGYAKRDSPGYIPLKVVLVQLNESGERLWYQSEYATVVEYDQQNKTITLERGLYGTTPLLHMKGRTYIAPIAGSVWGKDAMWYYNLSSACPKDKDGKTAADVYVDEIASWFSEGGPLMDLDGIAFDVNYFDRTGKGNKWDVDNDGKADAGWIGSRNLWLEGDLDFLVKLRKRMGDGFIMTCDAQLPINQQTPAIMNGMESEGLMQPMDSWRGFSRFLNTHDYWSRRLEHPEQFRYVVMKIMGKDADKADSIRKFSSASAFCMGASVTSTARRNYVPEEFRTSGSLGRITGELKHVSKDSKPLMVLSGEELYNAVSKDDCMVRLENGKVYVKPSDLKGKRSFSFRLKGVKIPDGDLTVFAEAKAVDPLTSYSEKYSIPRILYLRPANLPVYDDDESYNKYFTDLYGMIDCQEAAELSFYYRNLTARKDDIVVEVTGTGEIELSEIAMYNSPDIIIREFEHGLIVVNPSLSNAKVDITGYVEGKYQSSEVEIEPIGAVYLKRIK